MNNFNKAIKTLLNIEGGYVNSKYDAGGETNWGITKKTARRFGYKGDMKDMSIDVAKNIYKKGYWDMLRLDEVDDFNIAYELFDTGVNMGIKTAGKYIQRVLNVFNRYEKDWEDIKVDGKIGPKTIGVLNKAIKKRKNNLLKGLNVLQGATYIKLAENPKRKDEFNINGWFAQRVWK